MKKNHIAGLHLWKVTLRDAAVNLWVVTQRRSPELAARKASRVVKRDYGSGVRVDGVHHNGTIDA